MKLLRIFLILTTLIVGMGFQAHSEVIVDKNNRRIEQQDSLKIKLAKNLLIIENLPEDNTIEIYNIMGIKVYSRRIKSGNNEYPLSLPKGHYIIKIGKTTRKIAIK